LLAWSIGTLTIEKGKAPEGVEEEAEEEASKGGQLEETV